MPKQTLTVEVECDTPLEPVAEYHKGKAGQHVLDSDGYVAEIYIIVTPKKEPEVSEPEVFEIGLSREELEVAISWLVRGITVDCRSPDQRAVDIKNRFEKLLHCRVPAYEFPKELRVPGVYGIAADESFTTGKWSWWVFSSEPCQDEDNKAWTTDMPSIFWEDVSWMYPNVQMPTPEQCSGDWKQSLFLNPDFGKGE